MESKVSKRTLSELDEEETCPRCGGTGQIVRKNRNRTADKASLAAFVRGEGDCRTGRAIDHVMALDPSLSRESARTYVWRWAGENPSMRMLSGRVYWIGEA